MNGLILLILFYKDKYIHYTYIYILLINILCLYLPIYNNSQQWYCITIPITLYCTIYMGCIYYIHNFVIYDFMILLLLIFEVNRY